MINMNLYKEAYRDDKIKAKEIAKEAALLNKRYSNGGTLSMEEACGICATMTLFIEYLLAREHFKIAEHYISERDGIERIYKLNDA